MRVIPAIPLLCLLASSCSASGAEDRRQGQPDAAVDARFAADCERIVRREIPALEARYGMTIRNGVALMARSTWERMGGYERFALHWPLAYSASCALGRRGEHKVRMVDETGRELAFQMISTKLECHGDHAVIRPEDTEYPC